VKVPVIASLNGTTAEGWLKYARMIQQAGAHALELNIYHVATSFTETGASVEQRVIDIAAVVRESVHIPVAVKLSPFFSSVAHLAHQLDALGIEGLVLFNRFYQPDIDPERLDTVPSLRLSDSSELLLRLRWLAILSGRVRCALAVNGGVHSGIDALKALMAGADAVQLVSALLQRGTKHVKTVVEDLTRWMVEHDYDTLAELRGSMSLLRCPDPEAFERGNYMRILQTWRPTGGPAHATRG
jgi:dihydroorotate dehydrogenase (fumarate)